MTLNAVSTGPVAVFQGFEVQSFKGTFSIMAGSTDILSGTFSDATFGAGTSLVLSASNHVPGETLTLTSGVIPARDLGGQLAMSLSLAIAPLVGVQENSIAPFTGSIAGTFSSSQAAVPEPSLFSLMLMGLGSYGAWAVARFRRRT
ncbi:MAG: PEP-CTERM sorting domain-containing protein [Acidobacteria bacterium Pan2503]|uniref:PEP-CTERM sorting domain-containing protein n=1 Tax=Candidatus Acidiferrum panamense TaxID=2741543 RepID=A0A7V8NQB9_9BACT|nr:PEP-CTERM sorting domain-containing protein [Candidatus Acidoferrum panamensis]